MEVIDQLQVWKDNGTPLEILSVGNTLPFYGKLKDYCSYGITLEGNDRHFRPWATIIDIRQRTENGRPQY